jgi:Rrf2 family protein
MLSKKTKYAMHALEYLGGKVDNSPVLISEIADNRKIPRKFLEAILLELKKINIVDSKKGKGGGYFLIKKPKEISLATIVRYFNGPIALVPCISLNYYKKCDDCIDEHLCGISKVMLEVRDQTLKIFEHQSLEDILNKGSRFL